MICILNFSRKSADSYSELVQSKEHLLLCLVDHKKMLKATCVLLCYCESVDGQLLPLNKISVEFFLPISFIETTYLASFSLPSSVSITAVLCGHIGNNCFSDNPSEHTGSGNIKQNIRGIISITNLSSCSWSCCSQRRQLDLTLSSLWILLMNKRLLINLMFCFLSILFNLLELMGF